MSGMSKGEEGGKGAKEVEEFKEKEGSGRRGVNLRKIWKKESSIAGKGKAEGEGKERGERRREGEGEWKRKRGGDKNLLYSLSLL